MRGDGAADRHACSASCSCASCRRAQIALGIVLISLGIVGIAFRAAARHPPAAAGWALANAAIIARLHAGRRRRRARVRQCARATSRGSSSSRACRSSPGSLRAAARAALAYIGAQLAARPRSAALQPRRLRHRAVGDDARAGRRGRRAARDVGAVRRADRRALAEGRLRPGARSPARPASSPASPRSSCDRCTDRPHDDQPSPRTRGSSSSAAASPARRPPITSPSSASPTSCCSSRASSPAARRGTPRASSARRARRATRRA